MLLLCGLPFFSTTVRKNSKLFFLIGTGALSGILVFDLLPDLVEMGGSSSLWWVGLVWGFYSLLHLTHLKHHRHEGGETPHPGAGHGDQGSVFFLASMIGHCLASGMLLVASAGIAKEINRTVFWALLAHKAYEALTVSSILLNRQASRRNAVFEIAVYALSLPMGVALTYTFRSVLTPSIALIATSLAAGTLLGCLIFDFLIPSLHHLRGSRRDWAWLFLGLVITQFMMRSF